MTRRATTMVRSVRLGSGRATGMAMRFGYSVAPREGVG